jgi:hypothetical protein
MKRVVLVSAAVVVVTLGSAATLRALEVPDVFLANRSAIADTLNARRGAASETVFVIVPVWRQPFSLEFPGETNIRSHVIDPYYPFATPLDWHPERHLGVRGVRRF